VGVKVVADAHVLVFSLSSRPTRITGLRARLQPHRADRRLGRPGLERLYQYGRVLLIRVPGRPSASVDIGDADLSHFRLKFTGRHNVSLSAVGDRDVRGHAADGGGHREPEMAPLSR
jgi:hypothetical protein